MAAASIFDSISTGDILSNIGNTGLQSEDVAAIFIATKVAEENRKKQAEEKALRERERRLIIGGSLLVGTVLVAIIIYIINNKLKTRG
jgi:hypothetical protein